MVYLHEILSKPQFGNVIHKWLQCQFELGCLGVVCAPSVKATESTEMERALEINHKTTQVSGSGRWPAQRGRTPSGAMEK